MPPASVHQILLQALALLAAGAVSVRLHSGTGRTVITHRGRLLPVAASASAVAITMSIVFESHPLWIELLAVVACVASLGVMIHLSARWDSFLSLLTQAAATWSTFGLWMLGQNLLHSYSTGGAFWQPWNTLVCAIQFIAALFLATLQVAAIRGARSRARRPEAIASVAVAQRDRLGVLRGAEAH